MKPTLSLLIPANNEAVLIGHCLNSLLASDPVDAEIELIVISNASTDETVMIAESFRKKAEHLGWKMTVMDIEQGGKINALNIGDDRANGQMRVYLDADVCISPPLLGLLIEKLNTTKPIYSSGNVKLTTAQSIFTRAYGRIYQNVPFMTTGVPGCGLFAVNAAGRKRWAGFPDIISDDTFVRLQFSAAERLLCNACYDWPLVEGLSNLVKVRRRQDAGVAELGMLFPDIFKNDDKPKFGMALFLKLTFKHPFGMAIYAYVALAVRLSRNRAKGDWSRGR